MCIKNDKLPRSLTSLKIYDCEIIKYPTTSHNRNYSLINDYGWLVCHSKKHFITIAKARKLKLEKLNNNV